MSQQVSVLKKAGAVILAACMAFALGMVFAVQNAHASGSLSAYAVYKSTGEMTESYELQRNTDYTLVWDAGDSGAKFSSVSVSGLGSSNGSYENAKVSSDAKKATIDIRVTSGDVAKIKCTVYTTDSQSFTCSYYFKLAAPEIEYTSYNNKLEIWAATYNRDAVRLSVKKGKDYEYVYAWASGTYTWKGLKPNTTYKCCVETAVNVSDDEDGFTPYYSEPTYFKFKTGSNIKPAVKSVKCSNYHQDTWYDLSGNLHYKANWTITITLKKKLKGVKGLEATLGGFTYKCKGSKKVYKFGCVIYDTLVCPKHKVAGDTIRVWCSNGAEKAYGPTVKLPTHSVG